MILFKEISHLLRSFGAFAIINLFLVGGCSSESAKDMRMMQNPTAGGGKNLEAPADEGRAAQTMGSPASSSNAEADSDISGSNYSDNVVADQGNPVVVTPLPNYSSPSSASNIPLPVAKLNLMVPLYRYPLSAYQTLDAWWSLIANYKGSERITLIINPGNGPISTGPDFQNYLFALKQLDKTYVRLIGYVATDYGRKSIARIKSEIATYQEKYIDETTGKTYLDGIFFDEANFAPGISPQNNLASSVLYYRSINDLVKERSDFNGENLTIMNPGGPCDESFFKGGAADVIVVFENNAVTWDSYQPLTFANSYSTEHFAAIVHGVLLESDLSNYRKQFSERHFGWYYVTDDVFTPNPFDTMPSFWADLVAP